MKELAEKLRKYAASLTATGYTPAKPMKPQALNLGPPKMKKQNLSEGISNPVESRSGQ